MDAIIGAGGHIRPNDPLAELIPEGKTKTLLPIAGKPMIQWTLDAIAGSEQIENVIIIGLEEKHNLNCGSKTIHYLQSNETIFDNVSFQRFSFVGKKWFKSIVCKGVKIFTINFNSLS